MFVVHHSLSGCFAVLQDVVYTVPTEIREMISVPVGPPANVV